ncbi:MAG: MraY family glycosyltransferase [Patescibacteria group bacterium]
MTSLLVLAGAVAVLSWIASFGSRWLAGRVHAIAEPTGGRRIHKRPIPQLGGLGIGLAILVACGVGLWQGWFAPSVTSWQMGGFLVGVFLLLVGGFLDDRYNFPPKHLVWFPLLAALVVSLTGTGIQAITNPFGAQPWSLVWSEWSFVLFDHGFSLAFPSTLLTIAWMLAVTAATKFGDGLDGLVTGQTVIGASVIGALTVTAAFFQPPMTILCVIIGAAYLGFLPVNINPAKQFLGESGSTIAGFSLAFLSIASGAKLATALMAIGLPLADIAFVMVNRMRRGVSPFQGDKTHLHFRLLDAGLSQRASVAILWFISAAFGVIALGVHTGGKVLLLGCLTVLALALPTLMEWRRSKQRL